MIYRVILENWKIKWKRKKMINRGMLENKNQIIKLLNEYPKGTLWMVLRSNNFIDSITVIGVDNIPKGKAKYYFEKNRAYVNRASIREGFLPEEIIKKIEEVERRSKLVPVSFFVKNGQEIANSLKRKVKIIHQYGSGDQSEASFDNYEFMPEG